MPTETKSTYSKHAKQRRKWQVYNYENLLKWQQRGINDVVNHGESKAKLVQLPQGNEPNIWELEKRNLIININQLFNIINLITIEMLASKLFWMYFQSNSVPLAPTQNTNNRLRTSSAPAQPRPAIRTFVCPFPAILDMNTLIPTKSIKSTVHFNNSWS